MSEQAWKENTKCAVPGSTRLGSHKNTAGEHKSKKLVRVENVDYDTLLDFVKSNGAVFRQHVQQI